MKKPNSLALPETGVATKEMVADFLGVSQRSVDRLYLEGKLPRIAGLGRSTVRFNVVDVRKLCEKLVSL